MRDMRRRGFGLKGRAKLVAPFSYMSIPTYATMAVFGDSITVGVNASDQTPPGTYWASLLATNKSATLTNQGISGTVLQNSNDSGGSPRTNNGRDRFVSALTGANLKASVFIAYGFNDARYVAAPATMNAANYQADYREVLNGLIALGYARADIYVGSPYYITETGLVTGSTGFSGQTRAGFLAYVAAAEAVAKEYGVNYCDLYAETNNGIFATNVDANDNIHPTDTGHSQIYVAWRDKTRAGATMNPRSAPSSVTPTGGAGQITADCATVTGATSYEFVPMLSWVDGSTATDSDGTGAVLNALAAGSYRVKARAVFVDGSKSPWVFSASDVTVTAVDDVPDAFSFTDVGSATVSTLYTSNTITVAGLGSGISSAMTITGGQYSKNGGAYTSSAGTVVNGDTVAVQHTSSGSAGTATNTVLTIGGVTDTYTTTTAGVPGAFLADAFNGTSGTLLTSRNADIGGAWSIQPGSTTPSSPSAMDGSGGLYAPSTSNTHYQNAATPPSADYYVEAIMKQVTVVAGSAGGPAGRMDAAANTYYYIRWRQATTSWDLNILVAGTLTNLASYTDTGFTVGVSRTVRLTMTGTTITMHIDGVLQGSVTNSTITAAGKAGLHQGTSGATATTSLHIMDIVAV